MMRPAIALQESGEAFYFIADLHALTTVHDAASLREFVREVAIDFLACGLDPQRACLFRQSDVPEHTELSWVLSTVTPMGLLERCHSYKDKLARGFAPSHGLFAYPVLMAADILLYESDRVPVGKDQKQHLEVARDIAVKMNETYGELFKLPEGLIQETAAIVPGVDGAKMSKSYDNTIGLFMDEKALRKRVMSVVTDSTPVEAPKPTEDSAILGLYKLTASAEDYAAMHHQFLSGGVGYGDFKKRLFESIWEYFAPMRARRAELLADLSVVDAILADGARRARAVASPVMERVRERIGLR